MDRFNKALKDLATFMSRHLPYNYEEWKTNGALANSCKNKLQEVRVCLKEILLRWGYCARVVIPDGMGYYPEKLWVGILFYDDTPTFGVYPILLFTSNFEKMYIGCVESETNPQGEFSARFCSRAMMTNQSKEKLESVGEFDNKHLADEIYVFDLDRDISESALKLAINHAVYYYEAFRVRSVHKFLGECGCCCEVVNGVMEMCKLSEKNADVKFKIKNRNIEVSYSVAKRKTEISGIVTLTIACLALFSLIVLAALSFPILMVNINW